jgi:hypothetical protein
MVNTYGPGTVGEAKATIQAELDRIAKDFSKSLRECREAAGFLMIGSQRQCGEAKKPKAKPGCFDL